MRRSSLFTALACLAVLAGALPAAAQLYCPTPDLVAIVFDNGDINFAPALGVPFRAYLVLLNSSLPGADAFELQVIPPAMAGSLFKISETLPPGSINIADSSGAEAWTYIVGCRAPLPPFGEQIQLITWDLMVLTNPGQCDFFLRSVGAVASIPGSMAYNYTDSFGNATLRAMQPISGAQTTAVARLWPVTPLDYCDVEVTPDFTVTIAGEGETIIAGAAANATDGRDLGIDLRDTSPLLTFPRPTWDGDYSRDLRASYDPAQALKTWTFTVLPSALPVNDYQVDLSFTPTFDAVSGIALLLHDHFTDATIDLRAAGLEYAFTSIGPRTFDLTIGWAPPPVPTLTVDIAVASGAYSDPLTRAATHQNATDGLDPDFDFPEPSPPPGNYVSASFEQGGWPLGPRFSTDVRALFDPDAGTRIWPLLVETDLAGPVVMTFAPNFSADDNIGLQLRDLLTGQVYDLFPSLSYVFNNYGSPVSRHFELVVGASLPPDLTPTSRLLPSGWSMVGLPLVPATGQNTVGTVLLDPSPGNAYAFTFNRYLGYQSAPATATAAPGTGYWLGTSAPFNWSMSGTRALDGLNVLLNNGWNLVGNANWFPGPFEGLRVVHGGTTYTWLEAVANGLVSADVQGWNPTLSTYYDAVDLQPWHGYWINALSDDIMLRFHWQYFMQIPARLAAAPPAAKSTDGSWRSDLVLTDARDLARAITYGADATATHGFDAMFDRPMPPTAPGGGPTLSFQHPEWELAAGSAFTRDIAGSGGEPVRWTVALAAPVARTATLSWNPSDWPEGTDYQLYFPHENRVAVMSMRQQTRLAIEVGPQPLNVVMRTPDMTSGVDDVVAAGDYSLAAQPNPFNPATTVSFNLPQRGRAEVRIYSVRGELVDVLGGRDCDAGLHREVWRGRDRAGRDVPSGAYFGRLHVDGRPLGQVIRMSLVR
ncbi:MAG: hypothetical protein IPG61_05840 [bacterium]|nr:hypothetical protein [bacterium]